MSEKVRVRIPERHKSALRALAGLPPDVARAVVKAVEELPEPLSSSNVAESMQALGDFEDAKEAVGAILSLERTRVAHDWDVEDIAEAVASANELELDLDGRSSLAPLVEKFLRMTSVQRAAKASILAHAHERLVHTTRIISDIRAVFDGDSVDEPVGGVVTHQLELSAFTSNGREDLHFALDESDLRKLGADIDRALQKGETLKQLIRSVGLPVYDAGEDA